MNVKIMSSLALALYAVCNLRGESSYFDIKNVSMSQDMRTRKVIISYDLESDGSGTPAIVRFDITTNGVSIGKDVIKTVSGDFSATPDVAVAPGTGKRIEWNAKKDWPEQLVKDAKVVLNAWYTNEAPAIAGIYMMVDLSGVTSGDKTSRLPVKYFFDGPDVSDNACKTTQLWLRRCEPGTFMAGSPADEAGRYTAGGINYERQVKVTITKPFFVAVFPTTAAQYGRIMNGTLNAGIAPVENTSYDTVRGAVKGALWPTNGVIDGVEVKREEVDEGSFFYVLRERTGGKLDFDLPTETQWEYACRAGTTTPFNVDTNRYELSQVLINTERQNVGLTVPNNWGIYDFHGGASERCLDRYHRIRGMTEEQYVSGVSGPNGWDGASVGLDMSGAFTLNRARKVAHFAETYPDWFRSAARGPFSNGSSVAWSGHLGFRIFCRFDDEN